MINSLPNGELQAKILGQYFDEILKEAPYGGVRLHAATSANGIAFALANAFLK